MGLDPYAVRVMQVSCPIHLGQPLACVFEWRYDGQVATAGAQVFWFFLDYSILKIVVSFLWCPDKEH